MELWRLKNTDTRIVFPIVDNDGDPTSHADDTTPDSEYCSWSSTDHGGSAPSFTDCTHEFVEIGTSGFYYLDISAAEINAEFTMIICKSGLATVKTQAILIRTFVSTDALMSAMADAVADEVVTSGHTTAGSVGKLLGDNVNAPIGTVDTVVDTIASDLADGGRTDLLIDGIKAKTDNLPATPADDTSIDSQLATIAGYLDTEIAAILADTNELQTDLVNGGRLDLIIDAIKAKTDNLPATPADDTSIDSQLATIAGYLDTEIAAILADTNELQLEFVDAGRLDAILDAIKAKTDNLPASPAAVGSAMTLSAAAVDLIWDELVTGHVTASSFGKYLDSDISANTDNITAAYGTAEKAAIDDWINAGRLDTIIDAIKAKTDGMNFTGSYVQADVVDWKGATAPAMTGDAYAVVNNGTYGNSALKTLVDTITGYLDTEVAAILADTNELQLEFVDGGRLDLLIDAIKAKTDNLPATPADDTSIDSQLAIIAGYLDTEIAAILADTNELQGDLVNGGRLDLLIDAIKAKTDNLPASPAAVGSAMSLSDDAITSAKFDESTAFPLKYADASATIIARKGDQMDVVNAPNSTGLNAIADALLNRDMSAVTVTNARSPINALRALRNAWTVIGTTWTIYEEDDVTPAWTSEVSTDGDASSVTGSNPA